MSDQTKKMREWCETIRRRPEGLQNAIAMVQAAADRIEALEGLLVRAQPIVEGDAHIVALSQPVALEPAEDDESSAQLALDIGEALERT